MNKPPMKAIEQIKKYCEKTQCRKCIFGMPEDNNHYVGCELTELPPCEWDTGEDGDALPVCARCYITRQAASCCRVQNARLSSRANRTSGKLRSEGTVTGMESKYDPDAFFHHKRQTNAERIRKMTDKELSEFLWSIGQNPGGWNYINGKPIFHTGDGNGWLDWLQQEVDTNDN